MGISMSMTGFYSMRDIIEWLKELKIEHAEDLEIKEGEKIRVDYLLSQHLEDCRYENKYYAEDFWMMPIEDQGTDEATFYWDQAQDYGLEVLRCEELLNKAPTKLLHASI